jgi:Family of unknown function (DUF6527)
MKSTTITPEFVDVIPEHLDEYKLYISERYKTAIHRCCCGCGEEVVTPLTPADWSVRRYKGTVSMTPSIGNWSFACKSHYWIRNNRVVWAGSMTEQAIEKVRARDKADKEVYISTVNRQKQQEAWPYSWFSFIWRAVKRFWPF